VAIASSSSSCNIGTHSDYSVFSCVLQTYSEYISVVLSRLVCGIAAVWIEINLSVSSCVTVVRTWRIQQSILIRLEDDTSAVVFS